MDLNQISLISKALSDPNRLRIIHLLTYGEQCARELLEQMQITQSTLSHHMKILVDCGLVSMRKTAKWTHYSLNGEQWSAFSDYIGSVRNASDRLLEALCNQERRNNIN